MLAALLAEFKTNPKEMAFLGSSIIEALRRLPVSQSIDWQVLSVSDIQTVPRFGVAMPHLNHPDTKQIR